MPSEREVQRAIAAALAEVGRGDRWLDAERYLVYHLAGHAAAGGVLDELVEDARFLAAADPARLVRVLAEVSSETGRERRQLYMQAVRQLRGRTASERALALELTAGQRGVEPELRVDWSGWRAGWASC